jgi:hypothetical protein
MLRMASSWLPRIYVEARGMDGRTSGGEKYLVEIDFKVFLIKKKTNNQA